MEWFQAALERYKEKLTTERIQLPPCTGLDRPNNDDAYCIHAHPLAGNP